MGDKSDKDSRHGTSLANSDRLSDDDALALDRFCDFTFEDIDFDAWQTIHNDLNLHLTLQISSEEALNGTVKELTYSRMVKYSGEPINSRTKQRVIKKLKIPAGTKHGEVIQIKGEGDSLDERLGDLHVMIHVL